MPRVGAARIRRSAEVMPGPESPRGTPAPATAGYPKRGPAGTGSA